MYVERRLIAGPSDLGLSLNDIMQNIKKLQPLKVLEKEIMKPKPGAKPPASSTAATPSSTYSTSLAGLPTWMPLALVGGLVVVLLLKRR